MENDNKEDIIIETERINNMKINFLNKKKKIIIFGLLMVLIVSIGFYFYFSENKKAEDFKKEPETKQDDANGDDQEDFKKEPETKQDDANGDDQEEFSLEQKEKLEIAEFIFDNPVFIGYYYDNLDNFRLIDIARYMETKEWPNNTIPDDIYQELVNTYRGEFDYFIEKNDREHHWYVDLNDVELYLQKVTELTKSEIDAKAAEITVDYSDWLLIYLEKFKTFNYIPMYHGIGPFAGSSKDSLDYGAEYGGTWTMQISKIEKDINDDSIYKVTYNRYYSDWLGLNVENPWHNIFIRKQFVAGKIDYKAAGLTSVIPESFRELSDGGACFVLKKVNQSWKFISHSPECP